MTHEAGKPEATIPRTEVLAASIIQNALGEVRTIPDYSDRLIVLARIENALRTERDDVYEVMEEIDTGEDAVVLSYVQSYESKRAAEPLIRQEIVQELSDLVSQGELTGHQAAKILRRLEPFYPTEGGSTV